MLLIMIYRRKIAFVYDSGNECKPPPPKNINTAFSDWEIAAHRTFIRSRSRSHTRARTQTYCANISAIHTTQIPFWYTVKVYFHLRISAQPDKSYLIQVHNDLQEIYFRIYKGIICFEYAGRYIHFHWKINFFCVPLHPFLAVSITFSFNLSSILSFLIRCTITLWA